MGRLGTFVVVGALTAPVGGMVAADAPGATAPASIAQRHPAFFDLDGWYAGVEDGARWRRTGAALATFGAAGPRANGFGNGVAAHWPSPGSTAGLGAWSAATRAVARSRWHFDWPGPAGRDYAPARRLMRDAVYRGRGGVAPAAFDRTTFKTVATHPVRFDMRWSLENAVLAK